MQRKINRVGRSTLTVSLPAAWTKRLHLKAGDELEVRESGADLIISTSLKVPTKEVEISFPSLDDYASRLIFAPYIQGYDVIRVRFADSRIYDEILHASRLMIGFEVVENTKNSCKLVSVSTQPEQKLQVLIGRLFATHLTFLRELASRLWDSKEGSLPSLLEYEFSVNRLALYCRRIFHKYSIDFMLSPLSTYSIIAHIEESTDALRNIVETISESKVILQKSTLKLFEQTTRLQEINYAIFNKVMSGSHMQDQLQLVKEHRAVTRKIRNNTEFFCGDKVNDYICARLYGIVELSHHISVELFY